jgi:four helix bundle protein
VEDCCLRIERKATSPHFSFLTPNIHIEKIHGKKEMGSGDNTARNKSKRFAVKIVNLYKYLCREKKEFVLSKQLLRSGTSIGANLAEAECAMSKRDLLAKLYISFKECAETRYWLDLLFETEFITEIEFDAIIPDCIELQKMLASSTKTLREQTKIDMKGKK